MIQVLWALKYRKEKFLLDSQQQAKARARRLKLMENGTKPRWNGDFTLITQKLRKSPSLRQETVSNIFTLLSLNLIIMA